ncbi:hypothetical protein D1871_01975 [Nakamurella silvestris]|nr:hypothetical protein D1871_01975 [Nakamurella silvestris]
MAWCFGAGCVGRSRVSVLVGGGSLGGVGRCVGSGGGGGSWCGWGPCWWWPGVWLIRCGGLMSDR